MLATYLEMESSKISLKKIDAIILLNLLLIVLALVAINYSEMDLLLQKWLFDFEKKSWLIDKDEPNGKFIFYQLPKILFGALLAFCLAAIKIAKNKNRVLLVFLGLALIPLIAGNLKKYTNIYCPNNLEIYDGDKPYIKIFEPYPVNFVQTKKAQCFPAGHAVTGFALLILFFALPTKRQRILAFFGASSLGWILGFYQMAKGAHFFGDTLVAYLICFFFAGLITRIFLKFLKL